jgi:hemerythrin-like metal-binding protein
MEWDASLVTGHDLVDGQHRSIIALINEFSQLRETDCDRDTVAAVLVRLSDYVSTHFSAEEHLMERYSYPAEQTKAHRVKHLELSGRTRELVLAHRTGEDEHVCELVALLQEWLTEHIMQVDRRLVDHIREARSAG